MTVEYDADTTVSQDDVAVVLDDQVTIFIDGLMVDGLEAKTVRSLRDVLNSPQVTEFLSN